MNAEWSKVRLGDLLCRSEETIVPNLTAQYAEVTIKLWGKGVVRRGVVSGAKFANHRRFVVRTGQFILSRIDARNGALGLVPPELDGSLVSNDFLSFTINSKLLLSRLLYWICRASPFVDLCRLASEGTTNRVRLQEKRFLSTEVFLPTILEQQRIVEKIEELAVQIDEARSHRETAIKSSQNLLISMAHRVDLDDAEKRRQGWQEVRLSEVMRLVEDSHSVVLNKSYPNLGIYSFGRGLFHKSPIEGALTSAKFLYQVHKGQFIYSRLFAFEGAYGMVTEEFDGIYVSNEYPTFDCDTTRILPEFLVAYFKPAKVWEDVAVGSKGLGDRRQRVQPQQVLSHRVWLPPIEWQSRIAEVKEEMTGANLHQQQVAAQLDALLPAILDLAFKGQL